jgi:cysteine sulfinate desulfinase/cysteine desulfurase-like protein
MFVLLLLLKLGRFLEFLGGSRFRFASGTLRLSVGRHTTTEDVKRAAVAIIAAAEAQLASAK